MVNLDPKTINSAIALTEATLESKGYEVKNPSPSSQNEPLKESYKGVMTDLYSRDIIDHMVSELSLDKKSVALSTNRNLGKKAVEYATSANADLLLIFGYNGFNDIVDKAYLPMSGTPPMYSEPHMKGFTTVALIDGCTGAVLWTNTGGTTSIKWRGSITDL